jgi:hypothetical protein
MRFWEPWISEKEQAVFRLGVQACKRPNFQLDTKQPLSIELAYLLTKLQAEQCSWLAVSLGSSNMSSDGTS